MNLPAPQTASEALPPSFFERARDNMVEQQIRTWEVLDQDVLDLLYAVPREEFVLPRYRALALADLELPLQEGPDAARGERMWQPKMEARVLQELAVRKTDRVLEVGTGSGYLTALLAHRAAHVYSVEINPELAALGKANLGRRSLENITLEIGDAARGWPRHAPYDIIVLTGSTPVLPDAFLEQLAAGGRLFAVVGEPPAMGAQLITCTAPGACGGVTLFETVLKPLVNAEQPRRFRF
ncbi:MAG TPA: protein-L-isoaspartate O-methyltransferase [Burkholderiales bacterium]|nr:protein-L-isoaspartate O-methyltransferase [Burkholderiales bacterium]